MANLTIAVDKGEYVRPRWRHLVNAVLRACLEGYAGRGREQVETGDAHGDCVS